MPSASTSGWLKRLQAVVALPPQPLFSQSKSAEHLPRAMACKSGQEPLAGNLRGDLLKLRNQLLKLFGSNLIDLIAEVAGELCFAIFLQDVAEFSAAQ